MAPVTTVIEAEKAGAVANMITGIVEAADGSKPPDGSRVFLFTDYTLPADPTSTVYIPAVIK